MEEEVSVHPGKDGQVKLEQNMSIILKKGKMSVGPGKDTVYVYK
jgi:hypothetical protein